VKTLTDQKEIAEEKIKDLQVKLGKLILENFEKKFGTVYQKL